MTEDEKKQFLNYAFYGGLGDYNKSIPETFVDYPYFRYHESEKYIPQIIKILIEKIRTILHEKYYKFILSKCNLPFLIPKKLIKSIIKHHIIKKANKDFCYYNAQLDLYKKLIKNRSEGNGVNNSVVPDTLKELIELTRNEIEA